MATWQIGIENGCSLAGKEGRGVKTEEETETNWAEMEWKSRR